MKLTPKQKKLMLVVGGILLITVLAVGFAYLFKPKKDVNLASQYLNSGKDLYEQQKYSESVFDFQKALAEDPDQVEAYTMIAKIYLMKNRADDALSILDTAQENLGKNNKDIALLKGQVYEDAKNDLATAIPYYETGLADNHLLLAKKYLQNNQVDDASGLLAKVDSGNNDYNEANLLLAYINVLDFSKASEYIDKVNFTGVTDATDLQSAVDELKSILENALEKKEDESQVASYTSLGYQILNQGYYYLSIPVFEKVTKDLDEYWAGHLYLGYSFMKTNQLDQAEKQLKTALDRKADSYEAYSFLGELYTIKNNQQDALDAYQKAVTLNPDSEGVLYDYAKVLRKFGITTKAEQVYRSLDKYDKSDNWIDYRLELADLYINDLKQFEKSRKVAEDLIDEWSGFADASPVLRARIYEVYGWSYYKLNDLETAATNLKLALAEDKTSAQIYYDLGKIFKDGQQIEQAKNYLERAIDLDLEGNVSPLAQKELDQI